MLTNLPRLSPSSALLVLGGPALGLLSAACISFTTTPCQTCEPDDQQCIAEKCGGSATDTTTTDDSTTTMTTMGTTTTSTTTMTTLTTMSSEPTTSTTEDSTTTSTTTTTGDPECDEDLICDEGAGEDITNCLHDCATCTPTGTCVDSKETPYSCPEDCAPSGCNHDGKIDALSEQCDDGNMEDEDGCTNACALNVCGDGVLYPVEAGGAEECDDGNTAGGDGCSAGCLLEGRKVFVSSQKYEGNLGGLAGADDKCQTLAVAAKLTENGEQYRAWLSDGATSAAERLGLQDFKGPFELVDGTGVAMGWADLTDGSLLHAIDMDETGKGMIVSTVWTNTDMAGNSIDTTNCMSWTSIDPDTNGWIGLSNKLDNEWTKKMNGQFNSCAGSARLYCFQVQ